LKPDIWGLAVAEWRVGEHYKIHVYDDEVPIATFHNNIDAQRAVEDHNDIGALRFAISEALLTVRMWAEGSYQRGKTDADTIIEITRILEAAGRG